MRYKFLVTVKIAPSELCAPTKIAEVKNFVVLTDEGYNKAYLTAVNSVCEYIKNRYAGQEVRYTVMIAN
jgi:hypothetical protein